MYPPLLGILGSVALTWTAPTGCPTREMVEREVASSGPREIVAHATIARVGERSWQLDLDSEIDGQQTHRRLLAPTCAELADAVVLVLTLQDDKEREVSEAPPPPVPQRPSSAEAPRVRAVPGDGGPTVPDHKKRFAVGVAGGMSVGILATPAFGVGGYVGWLPDRYRLAVDAAYFPSAKIAGSEPAIGGQFELVTVGASACRSLLESRIDLAPCIGAEGGRIAARGEGPGVAEATDRAAPWIAVRGGLSLAYPMGMFALRADVGAVVPLIRDRFVITGVDAVHKAAPVAFRGLGGVEMRFP